MASVFSLEGKGLKLDSATDINAHIQPLKDNSDVEEIRFQGNTLGVEACAELAQTLKTKSLLRTANLADIFTSRLLSEIPPALQSLLTACNALPNLTTINLSDNAFGLNTIEPLRPFLSQHVPLQHLILNNNGLGPAAGILVAEALVQLADQKVQRQLDKSANVPELETVVCGRNRLEAGSMAAWARAYTANSHVREVRMVQNGIRQEGIVMLLRDGLSKCKKLEVLDLQDNTFTSLGSWALADVISSGAWPELRELGIGDCLLKAKGGIAVMQALTSGKCEKLEVLKAQYNEIDSEGLAALRAALPRLPKLRRVEINGNKFTEEDPSLFDIRAILEERMEAAGGNMESGEWGMDDLDDLEEEDSDEDGDITEDDITDVNVNSPAMGAKSPAMSLGSPLMGFKGASVEGEKLIKDDTAAEDAPVAARADPSVDDLANTLGKTEIK